MSVFKSHITQLEKIKSRLYYRHTMSETQMILGGRSKEAADTAIELIHRAIAVLKKGDSSRLSEGWKFDKVTGYNIGEK